MNIFKLLFELFLIYLAYKVIFEFIIPVYKSTKQMKAKMNEMHRKMEQHQQQQNQHQNSTSSTASTPKSTVGGDYIDYEEVK